MAEGSQHARIKPEDLRVECQACGGWGKYRPPLALRFEMPAVMSAANWGGPCPGCGGQGRIIPRKVNR